VTAEAVIELVSLVVTVVIAVATSYLAYSALVFTAKPKLELTVEPSGVVYEPGQTATVDLWLTNVGHWYAKPAAVEYMASVNLDEECTPLRATLGLECEDDHYHVGKDVRSGKGRVAGRRSRYFEVRGINSWYGENPERIRLDVEMPAVPGVYEGWLVLSTRSGDDYGLHPFRLEVRAGRSGLPTGHAVG
jgi:hypothetical protein